jgi:hypothetical protein
VDGVTADVRKHCDVVENWYEFAGRVAERLRDDQSVAALEGERDHLCRVLGPDTVYADLGRALSRPGGSRGRRHEGRRVRPPRRRPRR